MVVVKCNYCQRKLELNEKSDGDDEFSFALHVLDHEVSRTFLEKVIKAGKACVVKKVEEKRWGLKR